MHKISIKFLLSAVIISSYAMQQPPCMSAIKLLELEAFKGDFVSSKALEELEIMLRTPTYRPATPNVVRVLNEHELIDEEGKLNEEVVAAVVALRKKSGN